MTPCLWVPSRRGRGGLNRDYVIVDIEGDWVYARDRFSYHMVWFVWGLGDKVTMRIGDIISEQDIDTVRTARGYFDACG